MSGRKDTLGNMFHVRVSGRRKDPGPNKAPYLSNAHKLVMARDAEAAIAAVKEMLEPEYHDLQIWQVVHAGKLDAIDSQMLADMAIVRMGVA